LRLRSTGLLLFLFIPVVLVLLLVQPLGPLPSLLLAIVLMLGHRFVAQPFSERHRLERCLWCGRDVPAGIGEPVPVVRPNGRVVEYQTCSPAERSCAGRWLGLHRLATDNALLIRLAIVLPLLNLLLVDLALSFLGRSWMSHEVASLVFRGVIALAVVSISFLYLRRRPQPGGEWIAPAKRFPFPPHNLSLLGAGWTLWIFRIVGVWWLLVVARAFLSSRS
jgi:hypothetical protein